MAFVRHPALKRAMRADAKRTADLATKRVVGAFGTNNLIVRESEECGGDRIVPNAAGNTFGPNTQAVVATIGGRNSRAVLSRPPSGSGSVLAPQATEKPLAVVKVAAPGGFTKFIGIEKISDTSIDILEYDADGAFVSTLHSALAIGAGTWEGVYASGHWGVMRGDSVYPDGSLILLRQVLPNDLKVQTINLDTGTVSTHTITAATPTDSRTTAAMRGVDFYQGLIYFFAVVEEDNGAEVRDRADLYSANADLTTVSLLGSIAPAYSEIPSFQTHTYFAWCRVGTTAQLMRWQSSPFQHEAIDSINLDGSGATFGPLRTGVVVSASPEFQVPFIAAAHGDDRGYVLVRAGSSGTGPWTVDLYIIETSGNAVSHWPADYIQTEDGAPRTYNLVATATGGIVTMAFAHDADDAPSNAEKFHVTTFADVLPSSPLIQDVTGGTLDVFLAV